MLQETCGTEINMVILATKLSASGTIDSCSPTIEIVLQR
jgi:hypothetical protein